MQFATVKAAVLATELYVDVELADVVSAARTTDKVVLYQRKFAAVRNVSAFNDVGRPKIETRLVSLLTVTLWPTGPQRKSPEIAPTEVATPGTVVVRSNSEILTPGLT